jgi:hypothetical protein
LSQERSEKVSGLHGLGGLEVLWPKRAKPCQLLPFYNFVSSETSPTVKQDIYKVIRLISLKNLQSCVSYEFPLFNTSENHKS